MNLNRFTYFVITLWIRIIFSQICVNIKILGKMEMKGLKENIQDKKGKLERPNTRPNPSKLEAF